MDSVAKEELMDMIKEFIETVASSDDAGGKKNICIENNGREMMVTIQIVK